MFRSIALIFIAREIGLRCRQELPFGYLLAPVYCVLLLISSSSCIFAQDSGAAPDQIILNPNFTVFYSFYPSNDNSDSVQLRYVRDNIELPIDRVRFLVLENVLDDLKLPSSLLARVEGLRDRLEQFETKDKWEYFAEPEAIKKRANDRIAALIRECEEIAGENGLDSEAIKRLNQIRLQFACLGFDNDRRVKRPREILLAKLDLTPKQISEIKAIVDGELGDELLLEVCLSEIRRVFNNPQKDMFDQYTGMLKELTIPRAYSLAKCYELERFDYSRDGESGDELVDPFLIERTALTHSGKFAAELLFTERGAVTCVPKPWRHILNGILGGQLDWLQIVESQEVEIRTLKRLDSDEDGQSRLWYYGSHHLRSVGEYPKADWSIAQYEDWSHRFRSAVEEADRSLGDRLSEILLPFQLESIRMAMAIAKIQELGPYHVVENFMPDLELSEGQKDEIKKLREKRLEKLKAIHRSIHQECLRVLSESQVETLRENLGDPVSIYPCFWIFVN